MTMKYFGIASAAPSGIAVVTLMKQIKLKKSDQLLKPINVLKGVVVLPNGAYEVSAAVAGKK